MTSISSLNNSKIIAQRMELNMQTIEQLTGTLLNGINASLKQPESLGALSVNPTGQLQQSRSSQPTEPRLQNSENDKEQFTLALSQACIALKQYGKTAKELLSLRDMFLAVLPDVPIRSLTEALFIHLNISDEIPTPRQLREIITPLKPVWKPDWPAYTTLKNRVREGYYPLSDERKFLSDCDNYAYEKRGKELSEYNEATRQIDNHTAMLEIQP